MKNYLLILLVSTSLFMSCKTEKVHETSDAVVVTEESDEERPMFTVKLPNGTTLEHLYAEEIANGLLTGKWETNEDLKLAYASEYQLFLEPDSLLILDGERKVASVPYKQIGALDSIFIKDNE